MKFDREEGSVPDRIGEVRDEDIIVPWRLRARIGRLLKPNRNVVTNSDRELGQTQTVKMKIYTGDEAPIKLRPYRTPIHKSILVEEAARDMRVN